MKNKIKLIFDHNSKSTEYIRNPDPDIEKYIPSKFIKTKAAGLPEVSESEIIRHYINLSRKNFGVDNGFYPLGSCTMKYNPKISENVLSNFENLHPYLHEEDTQGALEIIWALGKWLCNISGMAGITFQPAAGAHGEITGLLIMKKYHLENNDFNRTKIIVPDTSHGTNPATATMAGYEIVEIKSNEDGMVDLDELKNHADDKTAGIMLTNPNTLGLFEKDITKIEKIIHSCGGLLYMDGANLNAIMCKIKPSEMGFDIMHFNLHKTFATPHGGGGPGSGPVAVIDKLKKYLPDPVVEYSDNKYNISYNSSSIGKVRAYFGNFLVMLKAYAYIFMLGKDGLKKSAEIAVLNANYLEHKLKDIFDDPFDQYCMHEFVLSTERYLKNGFRLLDIAKRLIDYGYHPPTVYFPHIVKEVMLIEPTETETKDTLDHFTETLNTIIEEGKKDPDILKNAPHNLSTKRLDETQAARNPDIASLSE